MTQAATEVKAAASTVEADEYGHRWIGAATVALTLPQAKRADLRGSIRVPEQTRIDVLECYCKGCRRPFEDVAGTRCAAVTDPELFHGGPLGTRAKRTGHGLAGHDCIALGCNTAIAVAAAQTQAARRNGTATDIRKPPPAPAAPEAQRRGRTPRRARTAAAIQLAAVPVLSPDEEARLAGRILASRRGRKRERNPLALTLW
jgi:hypothetical protein